MTVYISMPSITSYGCTNRAAFSLVQLSIVLTIMAVLTAGALPLVNQRLSERQYEKTLTRVYAIQNALRGYRAATRTYPCPADATLPTLSTNFGVAMLPKGTCNGGNFGSSNQVVAGMLPVKSLGLPEDYALDGWGRRFTYVVDQRTTHIVDPIAPTSFVTIACTAGSRNVQITTPFQHGLAAGDSLSILGWPVLAALTCPSLNILGTRTVTQVTSPTSFTFQQTSPAILGLSITIGGVNIKKSSGQDCSDITNNLAVRVRVQNGTERKAALVLLSHGPNGHGAFPAAGSSIANRVNASSTDADERENASMNASFGTNFDALFVSRNPSTSFDDVVEYTTTCAQ